MLLLLTRKKNGREMRFSTIYLSFSVEEDLEIQDDLFKRTNVELKWFQCGLVQFYVLC